MTALIPAPPARPTGPLQATGSKGEVRNQPGTGLVWWDGQNWDLLGDGGSATGNYLSVLDFEGEDGDLAAVNRAIAAFKSGLYRVRGIHFPASAYMFTGPIDVGGCNGMTISGDGADLSVMTCVSAINALFIASSALATITFDGLGFTGNSNMPATVPTRARTTAGVSFQHAVQFDGSLVPGETNPVITDVTFQRCKVSHTSSLPVFFRGCGGRTRILECEFVNCMDVGLIYCTDVLVNRNRAFSGADNGFSISRGCRKAIVSNNRVEGCAYHGIWISGFVIDAGGGSPGPGSDTGPQDFTCTGNVVLNVGRSGIALIDAPKWGTVTGNVVDTVSRGDLSAPSDNYGLGIYICGYPDTLPGAPTDYAEGLVVTDNVLTNCAKGGIFLKSAVRNSVISDNLVINAGSQYLADGTTLATSTTDNLNNFGVSADNISTHSNLEVSYNLVIDTRTANSPRWTNFSVAVSTTISGLRAAGNRGLGTAEVIRGSNATESFDTWFAAKTITALLTATAGIRIGSTAGTTNLFVRVDGAAGNARRLVLGTGNQLDRWAWVANGNAEGGSNAGSDLELRSYTDAGALLLSVLTVTRSTGLMSFGDAVNWAFGTTTGTKIGTSATQKIGFWGATPVVRPTVTGAKGGNAALTSLMTQLAAIGLVVDSTT